MWAMLDHQWHLSSEDGSVDFLFGTADTGVQTTHAPDLGQRGVRTRDVPLPREDGMATGVDYEEGTTLSFEANVLTADWGENSDLLNRFRAAWSARVLRNDPSAFAVLKVQNAGRIRRCYGRPRRFAEVDADLTHEGYTGVVCDFATRDGKFYDETVKSTQIAVKPPGQIGFTTPLVTGLPGNPDAAFATAVLDPGDLPGNVLVSGEDTWPWIEVHGPITSPVVDLGDLVVEMNYTIPDGEAVLLDPRPWSRQVIRLSDGANLAGKLTWKTPPMGQWLLTPGSYPFTLRGSDPTASAFAIVSWREAHRRP